MCMVLTNHIGLYLGEYVLDPADSGSWNGHGFNSTQYMWPLKPSETFGYAATLTEFFSENIRFGLL